MGSSLRLNLAERIARVRSTQVEIVDGDRFLEHRRVYPERVEALHHRRQMRHVAAPDETRRVTETVRVPVARRSKQERRGVHRAARHHHERRLDADRRAVPFDVHGFHPGSGRVCDQPLREGVGPELHVRPFEGGPHAADVGVALRVHLARKRVAGIAENASVAEAQRQRRRVQAERSQLRDDGGHDFGMRNRWMRKCAAPGLGGIDPCLAMHVIEPLGALVVRFERVVVDRPCRRNALHVLDGFEVFAPQPIQDGAPELGVSADVVVRVGPEFLPLVVEPSLSGLIPQVLPDRFRTPVLGFLWNEVATLEDEHPRGRVRQRVRHRASARAASNNDDVVTFVRHQAVRCRLEYTPSIRR